MKEYGMVLGRSPSFTEGGSYQLVIGGTVTNTDSYGYTNSGTVSGGSSTTITASTTATGGLGGLGADGNNMSAGTMGDIQHSRR